MAERVGGRYVGEKGAGKLYVRLGIKEGGCGGGCTSGWSRLGFLVDRGGGAMGG